MAIKTQIQPTLIFDTETERRTFTPLLDGVHAYVKNTKTHYVYDASIVDWHTITSTPNFCVQTTDKMVTNTIIKTSLLGALSQSNILPIDFLTVGRNILIKMSGYHSKGNGNITVNVELNGVPILTTGSINSGQANVDMFEIEASTAIRTIGAVGTINGQGKFTNHRNLSVFPMLSLVPVTINTLTAQTLDVTIQYANSNVGNIITSTNALIVI